MKKFAAFVVVLIDALSWIGGLTFGIMVIISIVSGGVHVDI